MANVPRVNRLPMSAFRLPLALLILVAVTSQYAWGLQQPHFDGVNFFGYFTILSSLFTVVVLLSAVVSRPSHELDVFRGAATLAMTIVWIVFTFLLSRLDSSTLPWVNLVLHYIAPPALLLDWLFDPPPVNLSLPDLLTWLLFPFAYVVGTLLRGSYVNWYPYWFLNPKVVGFNGVISYCVAILVLTLLIATALFLISAGMRAAFRATARTDPPLHQRSR